MTQPDIRGLIFDLDGVIADTAEFHYQAWQRLADEEGLVFSRQTYLRMTGTNRDTNLRIFTENLEMDETKKQEWMQRKDSYFVEMRDTLKYGDALPGVENLLKEAQAAGLKIGMASASRHAVAILRLLELSDYFQILGDGNIIKNSKPAPDIFVWVAGGLQLAPRNCLVLEDSPAGVEAALQGGFFVLGLGDNPLEKAHIRLPHLGESNLQQILEALAKYDNTK